MNEDVLRTVIRETIARHLGTPAPLPEPVPDLAAAAQVTHALSHHVSHFKFVLPPGDGPCIVEPHVGCTHCGFCQSFGH